MTARERNGGGLTFVAVSGDLQDLQELGSGFPSKDPELACLQEYLG